MTDTVLVMLTVPRHWRRLPVEEIARKLEANEPGLSMALAAEVKRWAKIGAVDLAGLQRFIDERVGT